MKVSLVVMVPSKSNAAIVLFVSGTGRLPAVSTFACFTTNDAPILRKKKQTFQRPAIRMTPATTRRVPMILVKPKGSFSKTAPRNIVMTKPKPTKG